MKNHFYQSIEKQFHEYIKRANSSKEDLAKLNTLQNFWNKFMNELLINRKKYSKLLSNAPDQQDPLGSVYQFFYEHELTLENRKLKIIVKDPKQREPGKVYTSRKIISFIIDLIKHSKYQEDSKKKKIKNKSGKQKTKVADIACGTGRFLTHWWLKDLENELKHNNINDTEYFGFDIDPTAIKIANQIPIKRVVWKNIDSLLDPYLEQTDQFDVIIGNPPYIESRAIPDKNWNSLKRNYESAFKKFDLSILFLEKIIKLLKPGGWAGIIITNKWLVSDYGQKIRKILLTKTHIDYIIDVSHLIVFKASSTYPIIIVFQKLGQNILEFSNFQTKLVQINDIKELDSFFLHYETYPINQVLQSFFLKSPKNIISTSLNSMNIELLDHFWNLNEKGDTFRIGDIGSPYDLRKGVHTGNIKNKIITTNPPIQDKSYKHAITSRYHVERFHIAWQGLWIHYDPKIINRKTGEYGSFREKWIFEAVPKIFIKLFGTKIQAAVDFLKYYANNSLILLVRKQKPENPIENFFLYNPDKWFSNPEEEFYCLLGILNSELISTYYKIYFNHTHVRGNYLQFYIKDLINIPLMIPNQANSPIMKEIAVIAQNLTESYRLVKIERDEIEELEKKMNILVRKLYKQFN
ncbi:N-6 DNA methylase [Promethearchaeum syntrophicum]|uniref:site-specific DNA-methyltransferase (adenine-specific) n=1 Tax=Promethearchaeum syntrophicum TaxID=2594042 RepID=A0A5B9D7F5_9ARCH|nr:N-6 DNA methylase [Candidatus Prometheoarchaeum syntrophicum]QEE15108.1 N5-glutamine S-adenosyl-L-methionine-dependent methyltransferase [Candidatus Prometheoarchaeum syntrophicum]